MSVPTEAIPPVRRAARAAVETVLYTNVFIALGAVSLGWTSRVLLGDPVRLDPLTGLILFGTLAVYSADRLAGARGEDRVEATRRHHWIVRHRLWLQAMLAVGLVGVLLCLPMLRPSVLLATLPLAAVSAAYCLPFRRRRSGRPSRLKEVGGLKTFLIAGVWAGTTVLLPALHAGVLPERVADVLHLSLQRFVFILAITLPFDLRDIARDAAAGIRTLPMQIGAAGTRRLSLLLAVTFAVLSAAYWFPDRPRAAAALAVAGLVTAALLGALHTRRSDLYYHLFLDGTMLLQGALVVLAARG